MEIQQRSKELQLAIGGLRERWVNFGEEEALSTIAERYENGSEVDRLAYHNTLHTKSVIRRTTQILETLALKHPRVVTQDDVTIGGFAAGYHDVKQDWVPEEKLANGVILIKRKRATGRNEEESAEEASQMMREMNDRQQQEIFNQEDEQVVTEAILATIPSFDPALHTVTQPLVTPDSSIVTKAVTLADIGSAGMEGGDSSLQDCISLFQEENINFAATARREDLTESQKDTLRNMLLGSLQAQEQFITGRKILFPAELAYFPTELQGTVASLFTHFDEAEETIKRVVEYASHWSLDELLYYFRF